MQQVCHCMQRRRSLQTTCTTNLVLYAVQYGVVYTAIWCCTQCNMVIYVMHAYNKMLIIRMHHISQDCDRNELLLCTEYKLKCVWKAYQSDTKLVALNKTLINGRIIVYMVALFAMHPFLSNS
jgi:hypothetical protein